MSLASKVVKIGSKIIIPLPWSKPVKLTVSCTYIEKQGPTVLYTKTVQKLMCGRKKEEERGWNYDYILDLRIASKISKKNWNTKDTCWCCCCCCFVLHHKNPSSYGTRAQDCSRIKFENIIFIRKKELWHFSTSSFCLN